MLMSVHSTSPAASSRAVGSSGKARSPWVVQTPASRELGITCQIASSMLVVAPSSNARRTSLAERSICRTPGANAFWTSSIACSVMRLARRRQEISSRVLINWAAPRTTAASDGGPDENSVAADRRIAPVSSSTATLAPRGIKSASARAKSAAPWSNSR